ncbi:unnamed protein product, partial [Prorocentrum cordatum]
NAQDPVAGFCSALWHLKPGDLEVISLLLLPRRKFQCPSEKTLAGLGALLSQLSDPRAILGDWGARPDARAGVGLKRLETLQGETILPASCTCARNRGGGGSLIDDSVVEVGAAGRCKLRAAME